MDSQSDQYPAHDHEELYSGRKLKIRRSPSCKVSAGPPAESSSSLHGSRSTYTINQQPLIIHTFDPEIITTEPDEFMWLVQTLTGSPDTRRSLRASKRKRKEVQPMQVQDVQLLQDQPSSPFSSNSCDLSSNRIDPLLIGLPLSSDPNYQLNSRTIIISPPTASSNYANYYSKPVQRSKYPAAPNLSCNCNPLPLFNPSPLTINSTNPSTPAINSTNYPSPLSPLNPNPITLHTHPSPSFPRPNTLTINNNPTPPSPDPHSFTDPLKDLTSRPQLAPISCDSGITGHLFLIQPTHHERTNRCHPGSPASGLTTSSEDCHTDLSTESCTASPCMEALSPKQGSNIIMEAEHAEDGSNFFLFSLDSYYGSQAAQDDLDLMHGIVDSSCSSMTLTPTEAFNLSFLKDLTTWLPMMDEII